MLKQFKRALTSDYVVNCVVPFCLFCNMIVDWEDILVVDFFVVVVNFHPRTSPHGIVNKTLKAIYHAVINP